MITIFIDGKPYPVEEGQNLLHAVLSLGFDLPYFCWHPALHSVGACRQCAVKQFKNDEDKRGRIVMACMTPATEGTRISINDPEARQFRASVIEFLMVNHPHDCPVCDEGGECHLQDMTVMTGHAKREFRFLKRTHRNQYLGPLINHEMNRCIACYRCVRFYRNYAGGRDLDVFGAHDHVYFGRHTDGVLENEFSGNLVEVCPTGVFTDKTLGKHYTRKWDLQTSPSVCVHCSVGCNTFPAERYGMLRRIQNRYNPEVNGYFLCDRGRFGYEFVNSSRRIRHPLLRGQPVESAEAIRLVKDWVGDRMKVIGIGSPRASLESNFALRELVGEERFYSGDSGLLLTQTLEILQRGPVPVASLKEAAEADAVLVLGEDVINVSPMLALALRQAARQKGLKAAYKLKIPAWHDSALREVIQDKTGPVFIATTAATPLESAAEASYHAAPDDIARLGFAVAHLLDAQAPQPPGLPSDVLKIAQRIAEALLGAERPFVICGTHSMSLAILQSAANVAWALKRQNRPVRICTTMPECNSMGLLLMNGKSIEQAFTAAKEKQIETVLVLENNLFRRAEASVVDGFLNSVKHVVLLDHISSRTSEKVELVLPAASFAESTGTLVNYEGRAQRFFEVCAPSGTVKVSWRWLGDILGAPWKTEDAVTKALAGALPQFSGIAGLTPPEDFRIDGCKIARQPHRYSGRTAMNANHSVHEPKPPADPDSPLNFSMEGFEGSFPSPLVDRYWLPGWNSVQSLNRYRDEIYGPRAAVNPGKLLIEPDPARAVEFFANMPQAFVRRKDQWLVVPFYHIFGSEELSMQAPGIGQLAPVPYIALNPEDARALNLEENEMATLNPDGIAPSLPVRLRPDLPKGLAGVPQGLPGFPFMKMPLWARIIKQSQNP